MSDLPAGWIISQLEEVAQWGSGGTPSRTKPEYYGGKIPWIKTGELGQKYITDTEEKITELGLKNSSAKLFKKGSVAIAMYGATIGKTSILGIDATTNQACAVGFPIDGVVTSDYLYYYLCSQKESFINSGQGGAQPNISQGIIKSWDIPLAPLDEQKRIAEKLDSLLTRVDSCQSHLERVPQILKRFRQSVLAAATSGRLTEDWREKNGKHNEKTAKQQVAEILADRQKKSKKAPENHLLDEEFDIPEGWLWVSLDSLSSQIVDGTHFTPNYIDKGIPFISVKDIRNGKIDFSDTKFIDKREHLELIKRCKPEIGDLLITKSGTIGRTAIVNTEIEFSLFVSVALIKPASKLVNLRYVDMALQNWINSIDISSRIVGSTIKNLHIRDMRVLAVPFPSLEEQAEIVRRVESLFAYAERLEARYLSTSEHVERLTPSLLAKAFRGELVEQEVNDE